MMRILADLQRYDAADLVGVFLIRNIVHLALNTSEGYRLGSHRGLFFARVDVWFAVFETCKLGIMVCSCRKIRKCMKIYL
jgi:hypothetical protein